MPPRVKYPPRSIDYMARVTKNAAQAIGSGVTAALTWQVEAFDDGNLFDPAQPTRLTAVIGGKYLVMVQAAMLNTPDTFGDRLSIRRNGATVYGSDISTSTSFPSILRAEAIVDLAPGDYVEATYADTGGAAGNSVTVVDSFFSMLYVGP